VTLSHNDQPIIVARTNNSEAGSFVLKVANKTNVIHAPVIRNASSLTWLMFLLDLCAKNFSINLARKQHRTTVTAIPDSDALAPQILNFDASGRVLPCVGRHISHDFVRHSIYDQKPCYFDNTDLRSSHIAAPVATLQPTFVQ
jgi:hypothetical protein